MNEEAGAAFIIMPPDALLPMVFWHGGEAHEAARLAFSNLEQAGDGFDKTVGLARLRPRHDVAKMIADQLHHQGIQVIALFGTQLAAVFEQGPTQSFQIEIGLLFDATPLVDGVRGMYHHMKLVASHASSGKQVRNALDEGRRHADADRFHLARIGAVLLQVVREIGNSLAVASLGHEHLARRAVM